MTNSDVHIKTCTRIFIETLFTIAKTRTLSNVLHLLVGKQTVGQWNTYKWGTSQQ